MASFASFLSILLACFGLSTATFKSEPVRRGASEICQELNSTLSNIIVTKNENDYETLRTENWVQTAWGEPTCIFHPLNVQEIQTVLPILVKSNVRFAVRSGGHSPHHGFANIDDGVLIDMSNFNGIKYEAEKDIVTVGVGLTWGDLYTDLEQYQMTVVGGRILDVGIGGLTLGGGLSWLTDLYGLACDNVVNFQVVLADGSIVNANNETNVDLYGALKGGGNNFGILTEVTLITYQLGQVWGGIKTYTIEQFQDLITAYSEYQSVTEKDPYANLIILLSPTNNTIGIWVSMVYLKPEENPAAFKPFYSINTTSDSTRIKSYTEYLAEYAVPKEQRFDWFTTSFNLNQSLYTEIANTITTSEVIETVKSATAGFIGITWQPISQNVAGLGKARGGNSLGLQPVAQTWLATAVSWWWPDDDGKVHGAGNDMVNEIESATISARDHLSYKFMNDASWSQQVISSYGGENVKKLEEIQKKYDPKSVFQQLVPGGFKLPIEP